MRDIAHYTSVKFNNFKAFKDFSVALRDFNVLVGPNNAGKSTILGAFRILEEAMRKARSRKPIIVPSPDGETRGYSIPLDGIPVATENVFFNYNDTKPASVKFRISNGNELLLFFPEQGSCYLICKTNGKSINTPANFTKEYNAPIGFVPILGPVEHNEPLYQKEAARSALLTHRAARNFRNIWHHYPDGFNNFKKLIKQTWPGMDILAPEVDYSHKNPRLHMFCPEERIPREIFWAGFGFQVWCQMLTYIIRSQESSLFIIDEPDIYLHSDLQRQLVSILKSINCDILIATHSTEIISETDPNDLLVINKSFKSAKRIKDPTQLQNVFQTLGSNLNPILTQLAKSKRCLFVEGTDFQILSRFARICKKHRVANRSDFAVVPANGFNPQKVKNFIEGIEGALGSNIVTGVIFDRDYRSDREIRKIRKNLKKYVGLVHIHERKEIENFLLSPIHLDRAIKRRLKEHNKRTSNSITFNENVSDILDRITNEFKENVQAQYISVREISEKEQDSSLDKTTILAKVIKEFTNLWVVFETRLKIVPGKTTISALNKYLQETYSISITPALIIECFKENEVPNDMTKLINELEVFRETKTAK